eukprot:scaffold156402_cov22-Tisochrysis_lutea.AAC.1
MCRRGRALEIVAQLGAPRGTPHRCCPTRAGHHLRRWRPAEAGAAHLLLSICAHNQPCNWQASQHERGHATSHAIGKHHSRSMAIQPAMPLACITAGDQPCNRQAAQQHSFKERAAALDKP